MRCWNPAVCFQLEAWILFVPTSLFGANCGSIFSLGKAMIGATGAVFSAFYTRQINTDSPVGSWKDRFNLPYLSD